MDPRCEELTKLADHLFEKKKNILPLWQEIADNFYPQRADFTSQRCVGRDFASNLTTSYPILAHRELSTTFSSMLRPEGQDWFFVGTNKEEQEDNEAKRWLERATKIQRRAMYDTKARFQKATSQADADFAAFGQTVISVEVARDGATMLYRTWHLRDVCWDENYDNSVGRIFRRWEPTAYSLIQEFADKVHVKVKEKVGTKQFETVNCLHAIIPADLYKFPEPDANNPKQLKKHPKHPYISVYIDRDNNHIMLEEGVLTQRYVIPRWQLVSGSQYAFSPATVCALPDARLIQATTLSLLEAGEKAANPPMVATSEVIRSDLQLFAGGVTWADAEYDERLGEVLRPISQDYSGFPLGMELRNDTRDMIAKAFYLDKLNLPNAAQGDMTAYEVGQRIQEYIRNALPLFGPVEVEYNGAVCEMTFTEMMARGGFGPLNEIPEVLSEAEISFRFESPLRQAIGKQKGQMWLEAKTLLADVSALDSGAVAMLDARVALRDALDGIGIPADWVRSEDAMQEIDQAQAAQQQQEQMTQQIMAGGAAAEQVGKAGVQLNAMQQGPQ